MPGVRRTTVGVFLAMRTDGLEHFEKTAGVIVDRAHVEAFENLREGALHQVAIFENVGDAGGHAQIVFENVNLAVAVAHEVSAGDVTPDAAGRVDADALRAIEDRGFDHFLRDDFVFEDELIVINVIDKFVQDADALFEATLDPGPFARGHDARDEVEGEDALGAGGIAVDVEGDAELEQDAFGGALAAQELAFIERGDGIDEESCFIARDSGRVEHLVVEVFGLVVGELHRSGDLQFSRRSRAGNAAFKKGYWGY